MKQLLLSVLLVLCLIGTSVAQTSPDYIFGNDFGNSWSWSTGTQGTSNLGGSYLWQFQSNATGNLYFKFAETSSGADGSGFWYVGTGPDIQYSGAGAMWTAIYHANMGDAGAFYLGATTGNYYIFKTKKQSGADADWAIFDNGAQAPVSITGVTRSTSGSNLLVNAQLSGAKSAVEKVWVRYSSNGWATSSIVEASTDLGGNQYQASIAMTAGMVYDYYAFTTVQQASTPSDADFFTVAYNNNGGANYRYNNGTALNYLLTSGTQQFSYLASPSAFTWNIITANDEEYSEATNIGFNFNYCGTAYSQFQVNSNGYVILGSGWSPMPASSANPGNLLGGIWVRHALAPLWDDMMVGTTATDITYKLEGTPGSQVLTVEWKNVRWNYTATAPAISFQVKLYEATAAITYHYTTTDPAGLPYTGTITSATASIGLNDASTVQVVNFATKTFLSVNMAGTAGARNYFSTMVFPFESISAAPDSNTVLTFTPISQNPLSGAYTVGAGGNFATLHEAANRLNIGGVSGAVTYNIVAGTYDDIFHLGDVAGTSASNTLTIQKQSGTVTLSPLNGSYTSNTVLATDAMIRLDGTRYCTVDGLTFLENATNATTTKKFDIAVVISDADRYTQSGHTVIGGRFNVLKNLTIDMNATTGAANSAAMGIRLGTKGSATDTSQTNSYNTIQDCDIQDFWRAAVQMYGEVGTNPDRYNKITAVVDRNKFHDVSLLTGAGLDTRCIELNAQDDFIIEKTDMYNVTNSVNTTNGLWGIRSNPASGSDGQGGTIIIRDNKIWNFDNTTAATTGFVVGIEVNAGNPNLNLKIYNNKIWDLYTNGNSTARAVGMQIGLAVGATAKCSVYNNLVYDLRSPRSTSAPSVRGLDFQAISATSDFYCYNNTVYLDNSVPPTIANMSSTCIYWGNFGTATLDLRNNILVNTMSPGTTPTTARATCIWPSAASNLTRLTPTSNNNLYYTIATPSTTQPIAYDGATSYTTMAALRTALATGGLGGPRETQSIYEMPPFVSAVSPYDVQINTATATGVESGGLPIGFVTTDFAGTARNANTPDIGAYEFTGTPGTDAMAPNFIFTDLTNTSSVANRTLTVEIRDKSGIASGADLPRLYYKKNTDASYVFDAAPSVSGSNYTFTIDNTLLGGGSVVAGDSIFYYIAAQDLAGSPNVGTVPAGGSGVTPPGTTAPATYKAYAIVGTALSGTYTTGLTLFNRVTGLNLVPVKTTVKAIERVPNLKVVRAVIPEAPAGDKLMDIADIPNIELDQRFVAPEEGQPEFIEREYDKEVVTLMDGDKPYEGPNFVEMSAAQLEKFGVKFSATEEVKGVYSTLTAAVADLNLKGVSGAVTLSLVDATYSTSETFPIILNSVAGTSASNTITIKPAAGVTATITGSNATALIKVYNTGYVTIDGSNAGGSDKSLSILNTVASSARTVWFSSKGTTVVNNQTIQNCILSGGETAGTSVIIVSDGDVSGNVGFFNTVLIKNNSVKKGRQGIYINGGYTPNYAQSTNLTIDGNLLNFTGTDAVKLYGIYVQGFGNASIKNNNIGNFEATSAEADRGIWVALGCTDVTVEKNIIHDMSTGAGFGANGMYISPAYNNANILVKNNFIYNMLGPGSNTVNQNPLGIFATGYINNGAKIYNNTFYFTGATLNNTGSSGAAYSAAISLSSGFFCDARNNIIYNALGKTPTSTALNGTMGVFAFQSVRAQFTSLDYNVYYLESVNSTYANYGHTNGVSDLYTTPPPISEWHAISYKDSNSVFRFPYFVSASDQHLTGLSDGDLNLAGTPLAAVTDDFDGDTRHATKPYAGADEKATALIMTGLNVTALLQGHYDNVGNTHVADTVEVFIKNAATPYATLTSGKVILGAAGTTYLASPTAVKNANYYVVIKHRNHLETWSDTGGVVFDHAINTYDFTSGQGQTYGGNAIQKGTKWCIYGGDVNEDAFIDFSDLSAVDNDQFNFVGGYVVTDITGDDFVDFSDLSLVDNNQFNFIGAIIPGAKLNTKAVRTARPAATVRGE